MILTAPNRKRVLSVIARMIADKDVRGFYPKLMHEAQQILCFQDLEPITIGSEYIRRRGHGKVSKFFHKDCFDRMGY
jgi:hypothetical protein